MTAWTRLPRDFAKLAKHKGADQALAVEAFTLLAFASAALKLAPFGWIVRVTSHAASPVFAPRDQKSLTRRVRWAVERSADRAPFRAVCIEQALAGQVMLRRRGIDAQVRYGVQRKPEGGIAAHAWLEAEGLPVLGQWAAQGFTPIAVFPQDQAAAAHRLLLACVAWPTSPERAAAVQGAAAQAQADWPKFIALVRRHRVAALALEGLSKASVTPPADLKALAADDARRVLGQVDAAARLQARLAQAGIASAVVKGAVLSQVIYGALAMRQCRDLDLLVDPHDAARAREVLRDEGFVVFEGPPEGGAPFWQALWLSTRKEVEAVHPKSGLVVELHHRLTTAPEAMRALGVVDATREVRIGPHVFRTFEDEDLFAYLCTHGAHCLFFRLKWLADIQAMLGARSAEAIGRLFEAARERGAEGAAGLALRLCDRLWGLDLSPDLRRRLETDRGLAALERRCLDALADPAPTRRQSTLNHLALTGLYDTWARRWGHVRPMLYDWELMRRVPLPRALHFLYLAARPFSWAGKRLAPRTRA